MRALRAVLWGLACGALAALGCGGSQPPRTDAGDAAARTDAADATARTDAADAAVRVPQNHRASGSTCPAGRGAGSVCTNLEGGGGGTCQLDSDCTAGESGRCFSPQSPFADCSPTACSYDQCQSDIDCPTLVPCECRDSAQSSAANQCVTGGNCATDADCGPQGFCSPGAYVALCQTPVYFCHTAADTCLDDSDCPREADAGLYPPPRACTYDSQAHHFACGDACIPPP
jgi:hypothetical protein